MAFTLPPVPRAPSTSELHSIEAVRSPSSASSAVPANVSSVPSTTVVSLGAVIITVGASSGTTVTVIDVVSVRLPASTTDAVIVCVPRESVASTVGPVPSAPSTSELHSIESVRSPSSSSSAVPVNVRSVPSVTIVSVGEVIVTVGGAFGTTVTTIDAAAARPLTSDTEAVIVCVPTDNVALTMVPLPSAPSKFALQEMEELRLPSSGSDAVPLKTVSAPSGTAVPETGAVIETVGGWLGVGSGSGLVELLPQARRPIVASANTWRQYGESLDMLIGGCTS